MTLLLKEEPTMKKSYKAKFSLTLAMSILLTIMFGINVLEKTDIIDEKPVWNDSYVKSEKVINDPQLEAVTREEEYIVSLINEMNDDKSFVTALQDWEYNLDYLKDQLVRICGLLVLWLC